MTKHFKVSTEVIAYTFENNEEGTLLTLTKQEYKFIQRVNGNAAFPQNFVDQETGIEYSLFDCYESNLSTTITASYHPIGVE
jgi:hypothetical protein